ncbi:MAG: glycogen debranching enzyme GlgX, partial [Stenotrophomonas sp.]
RNLLASLLFSQGTPMLLAGDEFGRTQQGNNNAYCQDNALTWMDWAQAGSEAGVRQAAFVRKALKLRRRYPQLRRGRFLEARDDMADTPIEWLRADGGAMHEADWNDPEARVLMLKMGGNELETSEPGAEHETLLLLFNAGHSEVRFDVPVLPGRHWRVLLASTDGPVPALDPQGGLTLPERSMGLLTSRRVRAPEKTP